MRILGTTAAVATLMVGLAAVPVSAKAPPTPTPTPVSITLEPISTVCSLADISPGASACSGFYKGNLLGGSPDKQALTALALTDLGFAGPVVTSEKLEGLNGLKVINFNKLLAGITVIGMHFGGANGDGGPGESSTAFYMFDAGPVGLDTFRITSFGGSSNAVLFSTGVSTAVPEPATWGLMILTVGIAGTALRRKRRIALAIADKTDSFTPVALGA